LAALWWLLPLTVIALYVQRTSSTLLVATVALVAVVMAAVVLTTMRPAAMSNQAEFAALLGRLYPLSLISAQYLPQLQEKVLRIEHAAKDSLIKSQPTASKLYHYLLSGSIERRTSFVDRMAMEYSEQESWCLNPLEDLITEHGGSIRALSSCELLAVSRQYIDELLALSQTQSLDVVHLDASAQVLIDDALVDDWTEVFLQTPLAAHLEPKALHELFSRLQDREVEAGELIVKEGSPGDGFYLLKKGLAQVSCGLGGALRSPIELGLGDYFGDESLVAHTPCNATVCMLEDGLLGWLDTPAFDEVLRPALVKTLTESILEQASEQAPVQWVDVRLPPEYKHGHREASVNYPLGSLRKRIQQLDPAQRYMITPECGRRGELATYLMRQAGLDAYLLAGPDEGTETVIASSA